MKERGDFFWTKRAAVLGLVILLLAGILTWLNPSRVGLVPAFLMDVTDERGTPLADVTVSLVNQGKVVEREEADAQGKPRKFTVQVTTDPQGKATLLGRFPSGGVALRIYRRAWADVDGYTIRFQKQGFETLEIPVSKKQRLVHTTTPFSQSGDLDNQLAVRLTRSSK